MATDVLWSETLQERQLGKKKAQSLSPTWWHGIAFEVKLSEIQVKLDMFGKIGLNDIT